MVEMSVGRFECRGCRVVLRGEAGLSDEGMERSVVRAWGSSISRRLEVTSQEYRQVGVFSGYQGVKLVEDRLVGVLLFCGGFLWHIC